jgi:hypothetical protein
MLRLLVASFSGKHRRLRAARVGRRALRGAWGANPISLPTMQGSLPTGPRALSAAQKATNGAHSALYSMQSALHGVQKPWDTIPAPLSAGQGDAHGSQVSRQNSPPKKRWLFAICSGFAVPPTATRSSPGRRKSKPTTLKVGHAGARIPLHVIGGNGAKMQPLRG